MPTRYTVPPSHAGRHWGAEPVRIGSGSMTITRPVVFWITISAIVLVALVLLRPILMPFAIGMALAYLLVPVVDRLERVGVNRSLSALTLILLLLVGMAGLVVILLPAIVG